MTNFAVTISLFAIVALGMCDPGVDVGKIKEQAMQMGMMCAGKTNPPSEDLTALQKHEMPTTYAGKCFMACMADGFDIMKDGKFNKEGVMQIATDMMGDDISAVQPLIDECAQVALGDDACENAFTIATNCLKKLKDIEGLMG